LPPKAAFDEYREAAVLAGRDTAAAEPTVGPDFMLVDIQTPMMATVQYRPALEGMNVPVYESLIPEMLTPWIIGPRGWMPPAIGLGEMHAMAGVPVTVLAPPGAPEHVGNLDFYLAPTGRKGWSRGQSRR
jgi:hypothetical protein